MMIQWIVVLLALTGAVTAHDGKEQTEELQLVQVVIRHGDRAAQDRYATDESAKVLFRGLGELSDLGIDNAHAQGHEFRMRYVDEFKFIDDRFLPTQVKFRASGLSRVLMSAGSFSNALFRKTSKGNSVVPPIYTKDFNDDPLLAPSFDCKDGWEDIMEQLNITDPTNIASTSLDAMEQTMWPASCKDVPSNKVDAIIAELPNDKIKMPEEYNECAEMPARKFMYDYLELLGGSGAHFNEIRLKRTVGMLTDELLVNMNQRSACAPTNETCINQAPKFRVYYSHDVNVLALSHVFKSIGVYKGINPNFSSALVFELWRHPTEGHNVKIYLKDGPEKPFVYTGLSKEDSKLAAVNEFAKKYAIKEKMQCKQ